MTAVRRLALAALLLSWAAPARADNTADEADLRFRRGVESYRAKKYEDALGEFFQSNRLVRNQNVLTNIARCYEQLKMYDEAYRYYREVLSEAKAEDRRSLEESLARLAPRVALLQVSSTPAGADVFLERKDLGSLGVSPKTLALPPGRTTVILALAGHREARRVIELAVGRKASLEVPLEFIWGEVKLAGTPQGAEVRVDKTEGAPEAALPGTLKVKPGRHIVNVSAPGFLAAQVPVDVQGDQAVEAAVALQPLPPPMGSLVVTANHDGALVRVDGKEQGFTPAVFPVIAGEHKVEVLLADMRPFEQAVKVAANAAVQVKAELRFAGAKTTAASKDETAIEDAPASVTIISREELRAFGYQTLTEALAAVRGFFTINDREYESLGVRGFAPTGDIDNRVLILYDGHPVVDVVTGTGFVGRDLDIDLSEIDHIEVVRGPVSSLYGTNAFFGVVNLVPRRSLGDHLVEASAAAGSLSQVTGRATGALQGGWGEMLVSGGATRVGGDAPFLVPGSGGAPDTMALNSDAETAYHGTARGRWRELSFLADANSREKYVPTGASGTDPLQSGTRVLDQRLSLEARLNHAFDGGFGLSARAYFDATHYQGHWMNLGSPDQVDTTEAQWGGVEVRVKIPEFLREHLSVGVEVQEQFHTWQALDTEGVGRGLDDSHQFTVLSAYVSDEARLLDQLVINASVRADDYLGAFGLTVNPRLAIIGKPWSGGVIKLMGGRSFRAPSVYERFYQDGYVDPVTGQARYVSAAPSPNLRPETVLTGELEYAQEIGQDFRAVGSVYVNFLSDLITSADYPYQDGVSWSVNAAGTVRTQGAELELRWQPTRLGMVSACYGFQQMLFSGVSADDEAALRFNVPAHMFALRAMFPISAPLIVGAGEAVFNSARPLADGSGSSGELLFLNLGLSGELPSGHLRYYAGVRNLLDQRAQLPAGGVASSTIPTYGRTFLIQLTASY